MGLYDLELDNLRQRRARAAALRGMANEPLPNVHGAGGRILAPVSWTERLAKLAQTGVANYQDKKTSKAEKDLEARRQADTAAWLAELSASQQPDELAPIQPTATPMPSGDAGEDATRVSNVLQGVDTYNAAAGEDATRQRDKMRAMALRGTEMGGVPAAVGANMLQREFLPPVAEPFTLGAGDIRFSGSGKELARGGEKERPEDRLLVDIVDETEPKGYRTIKRSEWTGQPQYHRPQAVSNVNLPPEESSEAKKVGEGFGDLFNDIQKGGMAATSKLTKLDRMDQLLARAGKTGKFTGTLADIKSIGSTFGIDMGDATDAQLGFRALAGAMALELRNPSGGAGMPGALSDKDREFLLAMTPGLEQTPGGNKIIIDTARALAKRDREVAQFARDYRKKHGRIDEDFQTELQVWADANPLFPDVAETAAGPTDETAAARAARMGL